MTFANFIALFCDRDRIAVFCEVINSGPHRIKLRGYKVAGKRRTKMRGQLGARRQASHKNARVDKVKKLFVQEIRHRRKVRASIG